MKRILCYALIAYACSSCSDHLEIVDVSESAIAFQVDDIETKGSSITNDAGVNPLLSMTVFCAYTGANLYGATASPDFLYKAEVTRASVGSKWLVQPPASGSWGNRGYYSFFSYAPYSTSSVVSYSAATQLGPPSLYYSVPVLPSDQIDVLFSSSSTINAIDMNLGSLPVRFTFSHALSRIRFEGSMAASYATLGTTLKISKVEISNIIPSGVLNLNMNGSFTAISGGIWTHDAITPSNPYKVYTASISNGALLSTNLSLSSTSLAGTAGNLMLMPQVLTGRASGEVPQMSIYFNETPSGGGNAVEKVKVVDLPTLTPEWQMGKSYTYKIVYDGDADVPMAITAIVSDWDTQDTPISIAGTYLSVAQTSYTVTAGNTVTIYYKTDGSPVSVASTGGITLSSVTNGFVFPATASIGTYTVTITAGKLSRTITVKVL